jgi:hypothetical protein
MIYLEFEHQKSLFAWARHPLVLKQYPKLMDLYAAHNTQRLNKMQAMRWKASGGTKGICDIFLPVAAHGFHGFYIEMKNPDLKPVRATSAGGLSKEQQAFIARMIENGYKVLVAYDWLDAKKALEEYLS